MNGSAKEQAAAAVRTVKRSRPVRTYDRYAQARGDVLAGGIAYFAFFSLFPALAVGLSLLGTFLRGREDVRDQIVAGINEYVPGLLRRGTASGIDQPGIYVDDYLSSDVLGVLGGLGVVTLVVTGLGWMNALRQGVRAVFGEGPGDRNIVVLKLYDMAVMIVIGLGVVVSVLAVIAGTSAADFVLRLLEQEDSTLGAFVLRAVGIVVPLLVDTLTFLAVFRLLPGANVPLRHLLSGAMIGGVGLFALKQVGTQIASRSADNPFLQAAASLVVILVLMNLVGRLALIAAAWAATTAEDHGSLRPEPAEEDVPRAPVPQPAQGRQVAAAPAVRSAGTRPPARSRRSLVPLLLGAGTALLLRRAAAALLARRRP